MYLNMQIIADNLSDYQMHTYFSEENMEMNLIGVRLLQPGSANPSSESEYVYIISSEDFTESDIRSGNLIVLSTLGNIEIPAGSRAGGQNIIVIEQSVGIMDVFNAVAGIFEFYNRQMSEFLCAVAQDATLSRCLNTACHLFRNPIIFLDVALTTVAHTKEEEGGLDLNDKVWTSVLHKGHVSINAMNYYETANEPDSYIKNRHAFFHTIDADLYRAIRVNIFVDNVRVGRLLIADDHAPLKKGHLAIADYIAPFISQVMRKQTEMQNIQEKELEQFVCRQLDGFQYTDEIIIQKHLSKLDWNLTGNYYLIKALNNAITANDVSAYTIRNDVFTHTMRKAKAIFDECIFALYRGSAFFIINTKKDVDFPDSFLERFFTIETAHSLKIGISSRFKNFSSFKDQYGLVTQIIEIGAMLNPKEKIYYYDDYAIFNLVHMFSRNSDSIAVDQICCPEAILLYEHDQRHNTNLLESLFIYLLTERSLLKAAKKLYIHRNSLVYRLEKINDLAHLSLDDPVFRMRMILSCYALYYMNGKMPMGLVENNSEKKKQSDI